MEMQQCILFIVVLCMSPTTGNTLGSLCKTQYFLASFDQFWISLTESHKNPQYKISWISVNLEPCQCMQGQT